MLNIVKKAMRITSTAYDDEIQMLIEACSAELETNNVSISDKALVTYVQLAVVNFCKGHFGNNPDSGKFLMIYENLKSYLMGLNRGGADG